MAQFRAFEDGVEVNGRTVLSVTRAFPGSLKSRGERLLAENGIEDPDPDEWYPQQAWLDAFAEISQDIGERTLRRIGKATRRTPSGRWVSTRSSADSNPSTKRTT